MRSKLQKFTDFANGLLPHETHYLIENQQFEDKIKLSILERIHQNCLHIDRFTPFDETIDKRKYSNLKSWITERLEAIDVDVQFEWMSEMERQIVTDSIHPESEKILLRNIRSYQSGEYYFIKFYELVRTYRHFLLIRMRYADHEEADNFLKKFKPAYEHSREVNEKIHRATLDIVDQYSKQTSESIQWEDWLTEVFYDENLDGQNRYLALVRLTFIYFNYRRFEPLRKKFDYLDGLFLKGIFYSKRILLNYYSNRLLLHSKFNEYEKAEYYGYLSVRGKNSDYIHYVNNLSAVLMREKKYKEAFAVMKAALPDAKTTHSFHNKIGFVAFYIKCLNHNHQYKSAESYGENFLGAYRKEIFAYRWHLFFTALLDALLQQKKYGKLLDTIKKYDLLSRDEQYSKKATYLPTIPWYQSIAAYKTGELGFKNLLDFLNQSLLQTEPDPDRHQLLLDFLKEVSSHIPEAYQGLGKG